VSGTPYDRGHDYGASCKDLIQRLVNAHYLYYNNRFSIQKKHLLNTVKKHIPFIEDYSPEIAEELRGISDGAEVHHEEVVMLTACLELLYPRFGGKCTSFASTGHATVDGETYVGQTSDDIVNIWLNGESVVLLNIRRKSGPSLFMYTFAGIPGMMGVNSEGIAFASNGLICEESKLGVPGYIVSREILHQKTIGDAMKAIINAERANSLNFLIASSDGEIFDIETTPNNYDVFHTDTSMAHANHFLSKQLNIQRDIMLERSPGTLVRYHRMNRMLKENFGRINVETLFAATKDHVNFPNAICSHVDTRDPPEEHVRTFDAVIFVPAKGEAWVAHGNPCQSQIHKYMIH
jgi:isopenicillin-N N-acyltransferase-like protein